MEIEDLSLLEISEEDDSLLQQIPSDEMSGVNKYLSCSPLLRTAAPSRASPLDCMNVDEHAAKFIRSSPRYKFNKENVDANKIEVPNLSNEPQQMKRRKQGGGYNLRKSIAWNRAFFTDEGVLDPSELSMISGAFNKPSERALSIIQEEGSNSICGDSDSITDSAYLHPLEEHLFKELPGSTLNQGKVIGSCFSPKCDSSARDKVAPASVASRKMLSSHDVNKSGTKRGGYSRPLASSSHKRPANASTTKEVIKELKKPKIPVLKPAPRSLPAATRSATLNNQIAGRALDVKKNVGFKGSTNSRRNMERNPKSGPGSKSLSFKPSVQHIRKDMANSSRQLPLSSNLQSLQVANISSGLGLIPDPELQATATHASSAHRIPICQNPKSTSGNMQSAQLEAKKLSSLRMPSPSLGFFGQPKASGSQGLIERGTLPCKIPECGIPMLRKLGSTVPNPKLMPPRAPVKKLEVVNDINTVRSLSAVSTVPSVMKFVSQGNLKLNLQKVDEKVSRKQLHGTLDDTVKQYQQQAEPSKIEDVSCKGVREMEVNDNKFLQSRSYDHLEKNNEHIVVTDVCMGSINSSGNEMENSKLQLGPAEQVLGVSQIKLMTEHQHAEDKKYNSSAEDHYVIAEAESRSGNDTSYSNEGVHGLNVRSTYDVDVQSEQDELTKSCFGEANQTSNEDNEVTQRSDTIMFQESRSFEAFQKIDTENVSLKVLGLGGSESESFNDLPQYREKANEDAGVDIVTIKSHGVDAELQCLDYNLSVESDSRKLSTFAVDNQCLMVDGVNENSGEPSELQNPCLIKQDCHGLYLSDFCGSKLNNVHLMSQFSSAVQVDDDSGMNCSIEQMHREDNLLINNNCVFSESHSGYVIGSSGQVASTMPNDCISGMHDVGEPCVDQPELTKARTCGTDQIFQEENQKLQASNDNLIEEDMYFDEIRKSSTGNVEDASPEIRSPRGSEFDSSQPLSQLKCIDQADEEATRMCNMTEKSHLGDARVQSLDVNQFVADFNSNLANSADHHYYPMVFDDVNKHLGEHTEPNIPCFSFDDSQEENIHVHGNGEFVASKCSDSSGSESKGAGILSWAPPATQEGDVAYVDKTERFSISHLENVPEMCIETEALVEDQTYLADTQLRGASQLNSQVSVTAENLKEFHSFGEESELLSQTLSGKADSESYLNDSHGENRRLQRNTGNVEDASLQIRSPRGSEFDSSQPLSQFKCIDQADEEATRMCNMTEKSHLGDAIVQSLDGNQFVADFNSNLANSADHHYYPMVFDDVNKHLGEHTELHIPCFSFDDSQEENIHVHGNGEFVASKCSDSSGSESKGAGILSWAPPATQEGGVAYVDKTRRISISHVENVPEKCIETEELVEDQAYLADTQLRGASQLNSQVSITAENLKEFHSFGEESELLSQTLSGKADSESYLNDSQGENRRLQRNNGNLNEETRSFEEFQKDDRGHIADVSLNVRSSSGNEPESSRSSSQPKYTEDANECASGVDNMARNSHVEDKELQLLDYNVLTESFQYNQNTSEVYNQLIGVIDDAKDVSGEFSKKSSEMFCHSSKKSCLPNHIDQPLLHQSISGMKSKSLPDDAETQNSTSSNSEPRNKLDIVSSPAEDDDATMQLKKSGNDVKQDVIVVKPPPNAVPFSDEWLAAMEAAGEDILAMKTGAVQHSPTDKSIAEPSPWSPVKRKNNQGIGPFDCTKYTNTSPPNSH